MPNDNGGEARFRPPSSTYRVQFNRDFTFRDGTRIIPYLHQLGVTDLYASPYLQARPGSMHGYDISDHTHLNSELGEEADHNALTAALRAYSLGHILDIVPNHMGIGEAGNRWWMDVLENGPTSPYAPFFDIDWNPLKQALTGKVLLPVLGDQFGVVLERGELVLAFEDGRFVIHYFDKTLPINARSSSLILRRVVEKLGQRSGTEGAAFLEAESIAMALENLPVANPSDPEEALLRQRGSMVSCRRLRALHNTSEEFRNALATALDEYNGTPGDPRSFDALEALLDQQAYRLAYWRVAAEEINYRRFFDINDLAGIRVERGEVFQEAHRLIFRLIREGKVTGLRVDHPDGLFDPYGYLRDLQAEATRHAQVDRVYVAVEKILTGEEKLPSTWPVAGTVGYEFLNRLNGLFIAADNGPVLERIYRDFIGRYTDFQQLVYEKKKLILRVALASELNVLAYHLVRISQADRCSRDFTLGAIVDALRETIACFPVYRTYIDARSGRVGETDVENIDGAIRTAIRRNRATSPTIFEFIRATLLLRWPENISDEAREEHALFVMKFQQLTGPVMAKGMEDTSFYIYNRLISLNEVGGEPAHFGTSPEAFHAWMTERAREWPLAMNGSSTHDTKRSEDVRARINVISEIPDEWADRVRGWAAMNADLKQTVDGEAIPDINDEYLLYQTLIGAWPLDPADANEAFCTRIQRYMEKSTREAKVNTSWINPNEVYDEGLKEFIGKLLDFESREGPGVRFRKDFEEFQKEIARDGMVNALAQTLVKLTVPGVPDIYQGQELWQLTLVDPDNRQPIDYDHRQRLLGDLSQRLSREEPGGVAEEVLGRWQDGRVKLYLTHAVLQLRKAREGLFREGDYLGLAAAGPAAAHIFAFSRTYGDEGIVTVVPRLPRTFRNAHGCEVWEADGWGDTSLALPDGFLGSRLRNVLTGRELTVESNGIRVAELLDGFPLAVLERVD